MFFKIWSSRVGAGNINAASYVGADGKLFYDDTDNILRIGDGITPGGIPLNTGGGGGATPDTKIIVTSEDLAMGDFVTVWNDSGTPKVKKADATTLANATIGFVKAASTSGNNTVVYFETANPGLSGLTAGTTYFLSITPGTISATPPSGTGKIVQKVGVAFSATEISFEATQPIILA